MNKNRPFYHAFLIVFVSAVLGRSLGFLREILLAKYFGVSQKYDIFLVAITVPSIIVSISIFAIPHALIPAYASLKRNQENASAYIHAFSTIIILILVISTLLLYIFAPDFMHFYSSELLPEYHHLAVTLLRMLCSIIPLGGIFAVYKSIRHAHQNFFYPAMGTLMINVCIISSLIVFTTTLGIYALVIGWVAGYFFQMIITTGKDILSHKFTFNVRHPYIKMTITSLFVVLLIETMGQMNALIDRFFLDLVPVGGISALNYAYVIYQLPIALFGITMGTIIFPSVSEFITKNQWNQVNNLTSVAIKFCVILTVPISFYLFFFASELVAIVYKRGAFDNVAQNLTASSLVYLSIGVLASSLHAILIKINFALQKRYWILKSAILALTIKGFLSYFWVGEYQQNGLALATSIAGIVNVFLLSLTAHRNYTQYLSLFCKVCLLTLTSCLCARYILDLFHLNEFFTIFIIGLDMLVLILLFLWFLKTDIIAIYQAFKQVYRKQ